MDIRALAGRQIDDYTLVEIIGEGGMSAVYRAYQEELERYVAVKILSESLAKAPDYLRRFNQEAKMSASLEHPHIVPVYDFGVQNDFSYVVMRLLHHTLGQINASENRLNLNDFIVMTEGIAKALDYAHKRGIVHRDVKPNNIMFDEEGTAYLVDFGIAKAVQSDLNLTAENIVMGTPSYMSPEQWRDENISPKVDQYGLAVVLFQTLTGELPFPATAASQTMYKHLHEAPPNATDINPNLPPAVNQVLQRALSKNPEYRYPLVSNFANALKEALLTPSASKTVLRQPTVQAPSEPTPVPGAATQPNVAASSSSDKTFLNTQAIPPKTDTAGKSRPLLLPRIPRNLKQNTVAMQVAKGGILGAAVLLLIAIISLIVLLVMFAPEPEAPQTNAIPTQADVVNAPVEPEIAVTSRGDATATFTFRGPVITPAVGIVGMDASQVRQAAILIQNNPVTIRDIAYSPDGVMVAAGDGANRIQLWREGVNGSPTPLTGHTDILNVVAFNGDGSLLASGGRDNTVRIWDTRTGQAVSALSGHTAEIRDLAFSPDGQMLASVAGNGTLRLWNMSSGQAISSIQADASRLLAVAFSPEGQTIATGGGNGIVRLWDPATGTERSNLQGHSEEVRSVAFSPDGQFIVSASTDNSAIIWRRDNGQRVHTLSVANDIFAVTFSPDSQLVATGGRDNNLRLWDVASGQELRNLTGHSGWVLGVSFAPDGASLVTGSGDGSVRVWSGG
jgi:serine/threonine protein kinase